MQSRNQKVESHLHDHDDVRALNLGLDIMEMLLAGGAAPTLETVAVRLNSPVEGVEHVVDFLETRGYLLRTRTEAPRPQIVDLDELRILTPAMRDLARYAMPLMQEACDETGQSCNLSVPMGQHLLIIAQALPAGPFYVNMPVGFKYETTRTAPGLLWSADPGAGPLTEAANPFLEDLTDISCRVMGNGRPIAVLTIPYLRTADGLSMAACASEMLRAAAAISDALTGSRLVA
jgi:DNA-binding IclR family transcriptional regulator